MPDPNYVPKCDQCGRAIDLETGVMAFVDKTTDSYPRTPDTVDAHLCCEDCHENGYQVPIRELLDPRKYNDWVAHLAGKTWFEPAMVLFCLLEGRGVAERIQELNAKARPRLLIEPRKPERKSAPATVSSNPRSISIGTRARIMERDGFRCRRCGNGPEDAKLVVDHVVPVSKGGTADEWNLQTLCQACNAGKSDRDPHAQDLRQEPPK